MFNHSFKGLLKVDLRMLHQLLKETRGKFKSRMKFRKSDDDTWRFDFAHYHRFLDSFNNKLQQLVTAGIINLYFTYASPDLNMKRYSHFFIEEPQILTMTDLNAGFSIWIICCSLGPIAFLIEWMIRIKDYFVVKYVLEAFFKINY